MPRSHRSALKIVITAVLLASVLGTAGAEITGKGKQVSVRFPAFSLSPGERITGIQVTASAGEISYAFVPRGWRCDHMILSFHCYSAHPDLAVAISGMLPEIIIRDTPASFTLTALVEFIDNSGKEYTKEIRESELIVK